MRLPAAIYHQTYQQDHAQWQTPFVSARMLLLLALLFIAFPLVGNNFAFSVANRIGYTILAAMGVQLLIGFTGQLTLGHAAFVAVGSYASAMFILHAIENTQSPFWGLLVKAGMAYPLGLVAACLLAGLWSLLFGLPSARIKGWGIILTTMAAQFITVDFVITQYVSRIGGRGHYFSLPPGTINVGPWVIDSDLDAYFLMLILVVTVTVAMTNFTRSRIGRAWIAIRDNDVAAEVLGVDVVRYKLVAYFAAGVLAGIAGSFWITSLFFVSPEHFVWTNSLWWVGVILIGGVGRVEGTIFGAIFLELMLVMLNSLPLSNVNFLYFKDIAFGLAIILFLLYEPNGLSYRWWQIKNYIHLWPFSY
jgi:branched-chain amino acid transport system permease protein